MTTVPAIPVMPISAPDRESVFLKVADYVSAAMGRPTNIMIWLIAVIAWTAVFAFGGPHIAGGTWLPAWFTRLDMTLARLGQQDEQIAAVENRIGDSLAQNTNLTSELKDLLAQNIELTKTVENLSQQVHAVVCAVAPGTA